MAWVEGDGPGAATVWQQAPLPAFVPQPLGGLGSPPSPGAAARLSLQGGCKLVFPLEPWPFPGHLILAGRWPGWVRW